MRPDQVAEGIDFDRHYGRCVVLFGALWLVLVVQPLRILPKDCLEYAISDMSFRLLGELKACHRHPN